ncbi:hypothetical protein LCGC14_2519280, partial [marine sediment metagenome]
MKQPRNYKVKVSQAFLLKLLEYVDKKAKWHKEHSAKATFYGSAVGREDVYEQSAYSEAAFGKMFGLKMNLDHTKPTPIDFLMPDKFAEKPFRIDVKYCLPDPDANVYRESLIVSAKHELGEVDAYVLMVGVNRDWRFVGWMLAEETIIDRQWDTGLPTAAWRVLQPDLRSPDT